MWQGQPAERRKAGSNALRWGCSGLGKGVGMGQGGYRGKQGSGGNRGSLEGEDCVREPEETLLGLSGNRMVLGRGSAGAGTLGLASFWGSVSPLKGKNKALVGVHREDASRFQRFCAKNTHSC